MATLIKTNDINDRQKRAILVVFNNSTILRLGGLSKNKRDYSVVEVVEKLDFQDAYLQFQREGK